MDKPSSLAAFALCVSVRPDRDEDGARPCSTPCAICRAGAAAVLRVAVDQVVPDKYPEARDDYGEGFLVAHLQHRGELLAIAAELEGQ